MDTQTVSNRMFSMVVLHDMHTNFFMSALEGISDTDAHNRLNTKANHIAWLTGSLVSERYEMGKYLGIDHQQSTFELFKDHKGIQDNVTYPPLADFKKDWQAINPDLRNALVNLSDEKLNVSIEMMPGEHMTLFDLIAFLTYREANCIGQIALWRRLLGYEAMKYM